MIYTKLFSKHFSLYLNIWRFLENVKRFLPEKCKNSGFGRILSKKKLLEKSFTQRREGAKGRKGKEKILFIVLGIPRAIVRR
jgi:hypothetical protein